ncbi:hypothetical protein [Cryobacterium shii]|uniref:Uncharacterized protein n=1 Tax=Cryobacterium shii TaxID=1259235 RepID=A0AAQ2HGG1_9MICO|nr:hypothetical protein [Cryobacterium shii]TFC50109.1 hypothetical protein E3O49_04935 [Cryobacterium shii]
MNSSLSSKPRRAISSSSRLIASVSTAERLTWMVRARCHHSSRGASASARPRLVCSRLPRVTRSRPTLTRCSRSSRSGRMCTSRFTATGQPQSSSVVASTTIAGGRKPAAVKRMPSAPTRRSIHCTCPTIRRIARSCSRIVSVTRASATTSRKPAMESGCMRVSSSWMTFTLRA